MVASDASNSQEILRRARAGDAQALPELFARYRDRLRRMVRLRLDRRLQGRVDPTEVVQEAYASISQRVGEYPVTMPVFLWMRKLTGEKLQALHQEYFGATMNVGDVSLFRGALPEANSVSLAAQLLGRFTPAAQEAERAEKQLRLQEALNGMIPLDREILALRHFEELNNREAAAVLGVSEAEASKSFIRALKRLKDIVSSMPGFLSSP